MLLVGVGNRMRGDDGVGPEVAERVAALGIAGLAVATDTEPLDLLVRLPAAGDDRHHGPDGLVVVDATAPRGQPGRVRVLPVAEPSAAGWSLQAPPVGSHALGLAEVVELARVLGLLPAYVTVVGVEAGSVALGAGLSGPVRDSVPDAVSVVAGLVAAQTL